MSRSRFLMAILPLVCTAVAANDVPAVTGDEGAVLSPTDEYERAVNDAARHYVEAVRQARARYLDELDAAMREATREGDLDRALQLRSARQQQQRSVNVIPNPLASVSPEERAEHGLRIDPTPPVPLSAETLTARPWYLLHRTGRGQQEKVIKLEPGGVLRFLEGAETSAWDDQGGTWSYEDGHLVLTAKTGVLARFEAAQAIILRSRVEDPHRFFWMQQEISDPFLSAGGAR